MTAIRVVMNSSRFCFVLIFGCGLTLSMSCLAAQMPRQRPSVRMPAVVQRAAANSGERKFRENCGRCHSVPEELSPRVTGTVMRHMRVRASLSAADEQDILHYLSP